VVPWCNRCDKILQVELTHDPKNSFRPAPPERLPRIPPSFARIVLTKRAFPSMPTKNQGPMRLIFVFPLRRGWTSDLPTMEAASPPLIMSLYSGHYCASSTAPTAYVCRLCKRGRSLKYATVAMPTLPLSRRSVGFVFLSA